MTEPHPTSRMMPHDLDASPSDARPGEEQWSAAQPEPSIVDSSDRDCEASPWQLLLALGFRP